ncbi:unnamed protein product [Staurois parvus]|uniref:Uncharacterized protein n=1 Tax=Staurois parvus TaxID=386267 RepID=A0ABN9DLI0_9NEOB|nr:unnamed protein product [Staurois parvus]
MRGDQRVNCVQGVFYWGGGLHCKHTALDGCAQPSRAVCPIRQGGGL